MTILPDHLGRILDLTRWAPSGDNTQPWRFEVLGDEHILVHGFDTRDHVVYDLDGRASQLGVGALLETLAIAASTEGRSVSIKRRPDTPETHLLFDAFFQPETDLPTDPLAAFIEKRVVQRRPMSTQPLSHTQKTALESALPSGYRVAWFEGLPQRWKMARFMFDNAKLRLTIPEAYNVHKSVIEWGAQFSSDKIPGQAVGVDPLTAHFMHWAMASWERIAFFNKWFFGHVPPRIQLDLLPGLLCSAHFALLAPVDIEDVDSNIAAGRSMQRFWLTAVSLGLMVQPEMTPVIFSRYARKGLAFTKTPDAMNMAAALNVRLDELMPANALEQLFFIGRIGKGAQPRARSTRMSVDQLLIHA